MGVPHIVPDALHKGKRKVFPPSCSRGRASLTRCAHSYFWKFSLQFPRCVVYVGNVEEERGVICIAARCTDGGRTKTWIFKVSLENKACVCAGDCPCCRFLLPPPRVAESRRIASRNRKQRERERGFCGICGDPAAIAAVNNAINRPASIASNSAEIEIQVAVAVLDVSTDAQHRRRLAKAKPPPSPSGQCVHPSNIRQIQMMRREFAWRILLGAVIRCRA